MTFDEYLEDTLENAKFAITSEYDLSCYGDYGELEDDLLNDDSVTGNGSGSFTYDRAKAEENIDGLVTDSVFRDALRFHGFELPDDAESIDVIARIIALYENREELEEVFENTR